MHALRSTWYVFRLLIYRCLGLIRFVGRPGSRVIVPLFLAGLAFLFRAPLHDQLTHQVQATIDAGYQPESALLDAGIVLLVVLACLLYVIASRILAVMLGAFPVAKRPLPPRRKLKPTETKISPAVVRVVVPPLPKVRA